jgi:hypothetical protein
MDGETLADLRARREALDEEIRKVELAERDAWNSTLDACEEALGTWLGRHKIDWKTTERKNEETWDIGHGALSVTFGEDEADYRRCLRVVSGGTLTLEWEEVPEPLRFLAIVAVVMGENR